MVDADFNVEGWDEFVSSFSRLVDRWEEKKRILLQRIGNIMEEEISPLIPVDTSNLVSKFSVSVSGSDTVDYSTNVEYALYVNDGHVQHRRFLPIRYLSAGGRAKYVHSNNAKGIMLSERYVAGKHYIENGMVTANPRIETLINSFMTQIMREAEGAGL